MPRKPIVVTKSPVPRCGFRTRRLPIFLSSGRNLMAKFAALFLRKACQALPPIRLKVSSRYVHPLPVTSLWTASKLEKTRSSQMLKGLAVRLVALTKHALVLHGAFLVPLNSAGTPHLTTLLSANSLAARWRIIS